MRSGWQIAVLAGALGAALSPGVAEAGRESLYRGPAPRPGPDILYAAPARAPQLENTGVWRAKPILVSGAIAYRRGELLYQDFLYDDHGAAGGVRDPADPRTEGDTFSAPNGTYTYPTAAAYAHNAADLVELRVKPLRRATAFRLTLNSMIDPELVAATIAIGDSPEPRPVPHGANATAPARLFLTVHGRTADLLDAETGRPAGTPTVAVDSERRQIDVRVPHADWNPGRAVVRLAAGVGLWDRAHDRYLVPGFSATETTPGGAGALPRPTAFFNVAFRTSEDLPDPTDLRHNTDPAWWRDRQQASALRDGDLGRFHADVDFGKLAARVNDDSEVPRTGPLDRILASRFEPHQGLDPDAACGAAGPCAGILDSRLQPYAIYVPQRPPPRRGYALTLLLHSLAASYNQFLGTRNQSQLGERAGGSIVITPAGRGPDGWYYDLAAADTFEVWADVARRYRLDPDRTTISGYSMGGYGTYKLAAQYPDLFAKGQPVVGPPAVSPTVVPDPGDHSSTYFMLASLRNVPFLIWDGIVDELVPYPGVVAQASELDRLGYRYEFDSFTADHFALAVNDQYAPAAAFLGDARVERDPFHVTYVANPTMDFPDVGTVADHAYWLSGVAVRDSSGDPPVGTIDVVSRGFGRADPAASSTGRGIGTLRGGTIDTLAYTRQWRSWGPVPRAPAENRLDIRAKNIWQVTIDPQRARVGCDAEVRVETDGPLTVTLAGCGRSETFGR